MKEGVLVALLAGLFLAGCAVSGRHHQEWRGIDYSAYEMPALTAQDDYTGVLPQPSILQEKTAPAEQTEQAVSEEEDFTSDEIASSYKRYTDVTAVAATRRIKLGTSATSKHVALFQQALDTGYKKALRTYRPSGFTYSISGVGAVNPLSDIEVSCILDERAASDVGQPTCKLFFDTLTQQYKTLLQEAQRNATL